MMRSPQHIEILRRRVVPQLEGRYGDGCSLSHIQNDENFHDREEYTDAWLAREFSGRKPN